MNEMTKSLPDAHFEQITLSPKFSDAFEQFCLRNAIPVERHSHDGNKCVYLVRAGMDYTDAQIMVYRMGWHGIIPDDFDIESEINRLTLYYFYWKPEYEYELTLPLRNNEDKNIIHRVIPRRKITSEIEVSVFGYHLATNDIKRHCTRRPNIVR